ncbi:response regulator [Caldimonas sp. KR1-144]|uniref:response regulator n=1 Tax=Caldimonas sp. KR1-144 TaxID=3400911 RepID=UPI003C0D9900
MDYLSSSYNPWGVAASILIASFASYVTLDLAKRVRATDRGEALGWWLGGSVAMGTGIWAMHFVGMLAFSLPIELGYTKLATLLSWLAAIAASAIALRVASGGALSLQRLAGGSLAMGGAICAMHYIGMAALDMAPPIDWNPLLIAASALIAVAASAAALSIFFWLRAVGDGRSFVYQLAAALVMGLAISGMHYTGMAAANFPAGAVCRSADALGGPGLGQLVTLAASIMLALTLFTSVLDARMQRRSRRVESSLTAANEQLQSARLEAQARFEAVFEHAPNGYLLFDRRRGITHCNSAAVKLFGADERSSLAGLVAWHLPLSPRVQPDGQASHERIDALMRRHIDSRERVQSVEWSFCRLDGTPFEALVHIIALDWKDEPEFCAVIEDVTARKQTEAAREQARHAAEAASLTKSNFLANMSHELRTPMNAIIGMTHLALEDGLPPRQRDYVEKAHSAARNLLQILNDILDISKIEAGHLELERIDFELETVVSEMADVLGLKADEKGLELLFSAAPDLPARLIGDPVRLRQVLVNLGSNAIKFTDAGEVTVGMELASQDAHSVELHGWVRDTGVGMTADQLARAFQPFMQADTSTTRRFGGTGLGLSIASQLVEKMGGRLWAHSEPGRGSTFHFTARFGRSASRAAAPRGLQAAQLRGRRALLVDDNAAALEVLGRMLEGLGITVDRAASGAQALQRVDAAPQAYSWIVLDWKMPGMDGVACARRIVERHPQSRACILLVTAFSRDDALRAGAGLDLAGVLQKPVTPSSLCDCLMQAGTGTAAPRPAAPPIATLGGELRERLAGARILLVEDHPVNQQLALELLRRAGMSVEVAGNGEEALQRLAEEAPFDAVLMDCQMPVMDGYTATRKLRENPAWRDLPVIAMTASALASDRERALDSGMNAHIAKPLDVDAMLRTLAEWTGTRAAPPRHGEPVKPADIWSPKAVRVAIDTADGLARCIGNAELYHRILRGFRQTQADLEARLGGESVGASFDELLQRLHDLKGLAGNIGAKSLQAAAQALHAAMDSGDRAAVELHRIRLIAELRAALGEIDRLLPADEPS